MAPSSTPCREDRRYDNDRPPDQRDVFQRDRDRILYTSAFRRLAGKTQVAAAGEGHVFHNRLTHTLEVAQIARRLAERLQKQQPELVEVVGGLEPEVVEAAAYAHDLGTPPFGHIAEDELDQLVIDAGLNVGVADGFGGNAQSLRVVSKLAVRHVDVAGLNLTRATTNAILKYPWLRKTSGERARKWGAYSTEEEEFDWARQLHSAGDDHRCVEAELMDWADDIAYSVHDVEDFYRAGLIPLHRLATDEEEIDRFLDGTLARRRRLGISSPHDKAALEKAFTGIMIPVTEEYRGTRRQRSTLRSFTAGLIGRYVDAIELRDPALNDGCCVKIRAEAEAEIAVWKELTWNYVIDNPALATQQEGQRRVIRELFRTFDAAAQTESRRNILPSGARDLMEQLESLAKTSAEKRAVQIRTTADIVADMTEQEAVSTYHRITGTGFGSILNGIMR